MTKTQTELLTKFVHSLLDDDYGISEKAYSSMYDFICSVYDDKIPDDLVKLLKNVDGADDRFYIE